MRQCTKCTFKRTMRDKDTLPPETAQFDKYSNNMWHVRHKTLDRFAQAARKVMLLENNAIFNLQYSCYRVKKIDIFSKYYHMLKFSDKGTKCL